MDVSSILAYKSLFLANRAKGTLNQAENGQKCTALANMARCTITASQAAVPLFSVSKCLSDTATNQTVKSIASGISSSNLKNIAATISGSTTESALNSMAGIMKFMSKLGLVGNIVYAAAKCIDAKEEDKGKTFMKATGNMLGMYGFEKLYSEIIKNMAADDMQKTISKTAETLGKSNILKSVKGSSILIGIGFVVASLVGCALGEQLGEKAYDTITPSQKTNTIA